MPADCCKEAWSKIADDEPVFIIRGRDVLAPVAIQAWLESAEKVKVDEDKLKRAQEHLAAVQRFQIDHPERIKLPD